MGKVDRADIELCGITVIAGPNNTGKSTVGKSLYSLCNGLYDIDRKISSEKKRRIIREVRDFLSVCGVPEAVLIREQDCFCEAAGGRSFDGLPDMPQENDIGSGTMSTADVCRAVRHFTEDCLRDNDCTSSEEELGRLAGRVREIWEIPDEELRKIILTRYFRMEFNGQINPVSSGADAEVILEPGTGNRSIRAVFSEDRCTELSVGYSIHRNAIYLDTPLVLGCRNSDRFFGMTMHQADAAELLQKTPETPLDGIVDEAIGFRRLSKVFEKLRQTIPGKFVRDPAVGDAFLEDGAKRPVALSNLSSGLKMLAIIRKLTENGAITSRTIMVLDEPEIHLHPEWQIILAEIIVLFRKEMKIPILFNTHSPYFLSAIEIFSHKYGIEDDCRYYRIESRGSNHSVIINADDDIEGIYRELAVPFQKLEDIRYEDIGDDSTDRNDGDADRNDGNTDGNDGNTDGNDGNTDGNDGNTDGNDSGADRNKDDNGESDRDFFRETK